MIYDLQKASMWKRISAFLFDAIMVATVAVAISMLVSLAVGYDKHEEAYNSYRQEYIDEYGIKIDITAEEYEQLSDEEKAKYTAADEAIKKDERVIYVYNLIVNLTLVITSVSLLFAFALLEFLVPLFFKNGQTLGKKIFGVGVMQINGTRIKPLALFIRTILGKYTVETMIPVFILLNFLFGGAGLVELITLLVIGAAQLGMVIVTKTNSAIHDGLASTVTVDLASQLIFETEETLIAYKKKIAAERAAEQSYP